MKTTIVKTDKGTFELHGNEQIETPYGPMFIPKGNKRPHVIFRGRAKTLYHMVYKLNHPNMRDMYDYEIHHVNFDRNDCRAENLKLVTPKTHKKIHAEHDAKYGARRYD